MALDLGGLRLTLEGLSDELARTLLRRYGPFACRAGDAESDLTVRLGSENCEYFIDPPKEPEYNPVLLTLDGDRIRFLGYRLAGWFEIRGGSGEILLARGNYEPADRAIENFIRVAFAWLAASRGGSLVHAASLVLGSRGYLFYGESGAGKSTLAACNNRGIVLSDDLSLVLPDTNGHLELVGSPFRGTYDKGDPVQGRFPLVAGFRLRQGAKARVEKVSRAIAWSGLVANLPFVNEFFPDRPELLATAEHAFSGTPLAHLFFCKDESYWDVVEQAGL